MKIIYLYFGKLYRSLKAGSKPWSLSHLLGFDFFFAMNNNMKDDLYKNDLTLRSFF
jgi:hypothetical protein